MAGWNGSGTYIRDYNWETDAANSIPITASRMQPDAQDMADNGFGNCLTRDGQGIATANLPMGSFRHTGVSDATATDQYATASQVQKGSINFAIGSGTGDAITATFAPAVATLTDGMLLRVRAPGSNTVTNPTFSPNGLTARTITKNNGNVLAIGEYASGQDLLLSYDAAGPHWDLLNTAASGAIASHTILGNSTGATALPTGITTTTALDFIGSTQGNLLYRGASSWSVLGVGTVSQVLRSGGASANPAWSDVVNHAQKFTTSGTFTVPAGATSASVFKFTVIGAGGGGGGGAVSAAGAGGGSGGAASAWLSGFTASSSVTVTIGAKGTGGSTAGTNGTDGGTSKITYSAVDVVSCSGGMHGTGSAGSGGVAGGAAGTATIGVGASGLTLIESVSLLAQSGSYGYETAGPKVWTGFGGSNPFGAGGPQGIADSGTLNGSNGTQGSGGSGGANAGTGGNGGDGLVLVEWVL